ncbi:YaeQ family protein [Nocardia zapadnayensis]|uniref:YaeQ family protein n=1 Tax=Nocardia rhamnosiphila TaxID=426716 RepID=UPI0022485CF0|nr:YaeQ family protein [Nocardia zapadnayensis]MCX0274062.1 YaeQ family protein [Nocardia zapadnayensis]
MATGATLHTVTLHLSDIDRGVYQELELRMARHPSETTEFLITRLLAYCLEYTDGIAFSDGGVSSTAEPAVLVRDLTGRITAWIEVGAPDSDRVHRGSKLAERVAVYTHRDPVKVLAQLSGKRIHHAADIPLVSFDRPFVEAAAAALERRNTATVSVTERQLYLELNGTSLSTPIAEQRLA